MVEKVMDMDKFLILWGLFVCFAFASIAECQIAETTTGPVQGTTLSSRNGHTFSAFMGIPYGKPPVGNMRFQSPEPAEPWTGVLDGTSYGSICPQVEFTLSSSNSTGDEDCLSINVFSHKNFDNESHSEEDLLPVLVYIHGGYFMVLSGPHFGPRYLMDRRQIVLVTFNYRLGVFGFLSENENVPGNAAMKDQVLALKWVQDNIKYFGGDPSRVTIYGESAGAAAVQYQLLSTESEGLFSAAISGSGTAFKVLSHQVNPLASAQKIAQEVGCGEHIKNNTRMVSCLQSVDASVIAAQTDEFLEIVKDPLRMSSPSTEAIDTVLNPFLTQHPYEIMSEGRQQRVPWMVGVNSGEGFITTLGILQDEEWIQKINSEWMDQLAPRLLIYDESYANWTEAISEFYLNSFVINGTVDFKKDLMGFTNMFSDRLYIHASIHAAQVQAQYSPVFLYYNDYMTEKNPTGLGTVHAEEVALIFSPANLTDPLIEEGHPDYEQSRLMVDLWIQFVTNPYNVSYEGQSWDLVDSRDNAHMNCFIFKNADRGQQGVLTLPQSITNRVNFWSDNNIPPYQDYSKVK